MHKELECRAAPPGQPLLSTKPRALIPHYKRNRSKVQPTPIKQPDDAIINHAARYPEARSGGKCASGGQNYCGSAEGRGGLASALPPKDMPMITIRVRRASKSAASSCASLPDDARVALVPALLAALASAGGAHNSSSSASEPPREHGGRDKYVATELHPRLGGCPHLIVGWRTKAHTHICRDVQGKCPTWLRKHPARLEASLPPACFTMARPLR